MVITDGPNPSQNSSSTPENAHKQRRVHAGLFRRGDEAAPDEIRIYSHSNIIYWWPVWLYAAVCWFMTWMYHIKINPDGLKEVNVFPEPWLGFSFLCVFFFVVTFSNLKVRGIFAALVLLIAALVVVLIYFAGGFTRIFGALHLLYIFMNEAFYAVVAIFLFTIWVVVVYGVDHLMYYRIKPGLVSVEHRIGQHHDMDIPTIGMTVRRIVPDLFRHQILGLAFLGIGTGDLNCRPGAISHHEPLVIENVIRLSRKFAAIEKMINKG
jgi:hypothetical protein